MGNALHLFRAAAVTPRVHIGNAAENCREIQAAYDSLALSTDLVVTPELSVTGFNILKNLESVVRRCLSGCP